MVSPCRPLARRVRRQRSRQISARLVVVALVGVSAMSRRCVRCVSFFCAEVRGAPSLRSDTHHSSAVTCTLPPALMAATTRSSQHQRRRRSNRTSVSTPSTSAAATPAEHEQPLLGNGKNKEEQQTRTCSDGACKYYGGNDAATASANAYCTCNSPQEKTRSGTGPTENSAHLHFGTYFGQRRHKRRKQRIHRYFTLRYHVNLIVEYAPKLLSLLFHGTPRWLFKLVRLLAFVMALLPGFVVFAFYYFWSADRIALPYREDGGDGDANEDGNNPSRGSPRTSRHFVDVYGSRTVLTRRNNGCGISYDRQYSSMSTNYDHVTTREGRGNSNGDEESKPVVIFLTGGAWIIGYKMWGALLARVLVPMGVLVFIPDYRNFPQSDVGGMVEDVDEAIQWTLSNCKSYGGDPKRVVVIGQSAGAHLGSCVLLRKALDELDGEATNDDASPLSHHHQHLHSSYKARDVRGFMAASGPYNITTMQDIFHRHGLDRNIVLLMFGNHLDRHSPTHLVEQCRNLCNRADGDLLLDSLLPPFAIVHGTADKTVPHSGAEEYADCLRDAGVRVTSTTYTGWSHTDPILEGPMRGDQTFHRDCYDFVRQCTSMPEKKDKEPPATTMMPFDDSLPACKPICWPGLLVSLGRFFNPF